MPAGTGAVDAAGAPALWDCAPEAAEATGAGEVTLLLRVEAFCPHPATNAIAAMQITMRFVIGASSAAVRRLHLRRTGDLALLERVPAGRPRTSPAPSRSR